MKLERVGDQDRFSEGPVLQVPTWFSRLAAGGRRFSEPQTHKYRHLSRS